MDSTILNARKALARARIAEVAALGEGVFTDNVQQLQAAIASGSSLDGAHEDLRTTESLAAVADLVSALLDSNADLEARVSALESP